MAKHTYTLRLNDTEKAALEQGCAALGCSKSDYLRSIIMNYEIKKRPPEKLKELSLAVNHIGVHINEIAKAVNTGAATQNDFYELKEQLHRVEVLLEDALTQNPSH